MAAAKKTTDHKVIRRWVEAHGGHPATVKRTRSRDDAGLIRIDFPGFSGEKSLTPISWAEWFEKFDEQELAFLYQEGKDTNFNKLVRRDPEKVRPSDRRRGPSRTTRGGRAAAHALASERGRGRGGAAAGRAGARTGRRPGRTAPRAGTDKHHWTRAELLERAREIDLPRRSTMNKAQLVRALERADARGKR